MSPLVMVVEPDAARSAVTEAVLAMGRFAVAPVVSVEGALAVCRGLMPAVIVCADADIDRLLDGLRPLVVPVVTNTPADADPRELIDRIRAAVRASRVST